MNEFKAAPTIFGGNTGMTYEGLQRKRKMAEQLMAGMGKAPKNVGEGLNAIGQALLARSLNKKADKRDAELRGQFNDSFSKAAPNMQGLADMANSPYAGKGHQQVISALMKGAPNYRRGTPFHMGGSAVVGENGPELVQLPRGAQVIPTQMDPYDQGGPASDPDYQVPMDGFVMPPEPDDYLREELGDELFQQYEGMSPEQRMDFINNPENGFVPPAPEDTRELTPQYEAKIAPIGGESVFNDDAAYKTADLAGITPDDMGVGQRNKIQDSAFAYSSLMKGLDDFEATFKNGGGTAIPGTRKDELATQHRNLQMQMKELYNLGVLNGPDLDLMNEILVNPTSFGSNALDFVGISDLDERIPKNIERVRKMMTNMVEPKLKAANINIDELAPKKEVSDEEFLKSLGLE